MASPPPPLIIQVRKAYMLCSSYAKNAALTKEIHSAIEEELRNMDSTLGFGAKKRHKRIAHRQYLEYDGVGPGTYSQRQSAHSRVRLDQSRESVFERKFQEALADNNSKEVGPHSALPPKGTMTTNAFQMIANEMIRDSIKRGEFSNLRGRGRPMEEAWENPVLSTMEQKLNSIMGSSGFAPDWIMLEREIKEEASKLREEMVSAWNRCGPHPMTQFKGVEWDKSLRHFQAELDTINKKIRDRNLKGPPVGQKMKLKLEDLLTPVTSVIPVSNNEPRSPEANSDNGRFVLGVTGFIFAVIGFWELVQRSRE